MFAHVRTRMATQDLQLTKRRHRARGITRLEAAMALTAVVLVAAGLGVVLHDPVDSTQSVEEDARGILEAASQWRSNGQGGCPSITRLVQDRALAADRPTDDPWGNRFRIQCDESGVTVLSPGRDGIAKTKDDVSVRQSSNS